MSAKFIYLVVCFFFFLLVYLVPFFFLFLDAALVALVFPFTFPFFSFAS